jgi:hypothetical protein
MIIRESTVVFKLLAREDELGLVRRYVGIDVEGIHEDLHATGEDGEQGEVEVRVNASTVEWKMEDKAEGRRLLIVSEDSTLRVIVAG